jgi:hypothetical protein
MRPREHNEQNGDKGRRIGQRRAVVQEVSLFDESGEPIILETIDIGPRGVFVRSDLLFDPGEELWVSLRIPEGPKLVVRGRVVRGDLGTMGEVAGMGISFVDLTAREESWLRRYIHEEREETNVWRAFLEGASVKGDVTTSSST